jgi:molybdopterin/thiamine biosynthesis adenylyltransferase
MNAFAQRENARTLAAIVGADEDRAAELLAVTAVVTYDTNNLVASDCAKHVVASLKRTLCHVHQNINICSQPVAVEVVIGAAAPRFKSPHVFVSVADDEIEVSFQPVTKICGKTHRIGVLLASCYANAAALKTALGDLLPFHVPSRISVKLLDLLGTDLPLIYKPVVVGDTYLAGAGAVGNGFIYALSQFDVSGELYIADDDIVGVGNLQRCLLFEEHHVDHPKAEILSAAAATILPNLKTIPHNVRIQDLPWRRAGAWLTRLVVGVDSPRSRRSLQGEFPGEVFDASTTGITEIVLHFHRQPTTGACLGCVYPHTPQENAHEVHIAEVLGVSLAEVKEPRISQSAAKKTCVRYPELNPSQVVGKAYDTLFKQLCSTASLKTSEDRQVLAPFAFVSVLAGALLAIEFVRRIQRGHDGLFNEWRISPWANPVLRRRRILPKNPACEFCGDEILARVGAEMWKKTT